MGLGAAAGFAGASVATGGVAAGARMGSRSSSASTIVPAGPERERRTGEARACWSIGTSLTKAVRLREIVLKNRTAARPPFRSSSDDLSLLAPLPWLDEGAEKRVTLSVHRVEGIT